MGGLHLNVLDTVKALKKRKYEVTVLSKKGQFSEMIESLGAKSLTTDFTDIKQSVEMVIDNVKMPIDIIHAHPYQSREVGLLLAKYYKKPFLVTLHSVNDKQLRSYVNELDGLIVVSDFIKDDVLKKGLLSSDKIFTIHNGVDKSELKQLASQSENKNFNNVFHEQFKNILVATRFDKDKEFIVKSLVQVWNKLLEEEAFHSNWIIAGEGTEIDTLKRVAKQLALKANREVVHFLGWQNKENLVHLYGQSDIFVGPGRSTIEAMSFGLPSIAIGSKGYVGLIDSTNVLHGVYTNFGGDLTGKALDSSALSYDVQRVLKMDKDDFSVLKDISQSTVQTFFELETLNNKLINTYTLFASKKSVATQDFEKSLFLEQEGLSLKSNTLSKTFEVSSEANYTVSGFIYNQMNETNSSIITFDFGQGKMSSKEFEKNNLYISKKTGYFRYLPSKKGLQLFTYELFVPKNSTQVTIYIKNWNATGENYIGKSITLDENQRADLLSLEVDNIRQQYQAKQQEIQTYKEWLSDSKSSNQIIKGEYQSLLKKSAEQQAILKRNTQKIETYEKKLEEEILLREKLKNVKVQLEEEGSIQKALICELEEKELDLKKSLLHLQKEYEAIVDKNATLSEKIAEESQIRLKLEKENEHQEKHISQLQQEKEEKRKLAQHYKSLIHDEYQEKEEKRRLAQHYKSLIYSERQAKEHLRGSASYQLGNTLLHGFKSPKKFILLPVNLFKVVKIGVKRKRLKKKHSLKEVKSEPKIEGTLNQGQVYEIYNKKGFSHLLDVLDEKNISTQNKADLFEILAQQAKYEDIPRILEEAYFSDATYKRGINILTELSSHGNLSVARLIVNDFSEKHYSTENKDIKLLNTLKGYTSLWNELPLIPTLSHQSIEKTPKKVAMFLHASLPHFSNGYATRSHGILTTLDMYSSYDVEGVTRVGYPWDVRVQGEKKALDIVDEIKYHHLDGIDVNKLPMNQYIQESAMIAENFLREIKPEIVHSASAYTTALAALIASRKVGLPFVYEVRGLWEVTKQSTVPNWDRTEQFLLEKSLETLIAKNATQVITLTQGLKDELIRRGVKGKKITVIPNSIDIERFSVMQSDTSLFEKLSLKKDVVTIGYIGSIVMYEGLDDLLNALSILKKRGVQFNFLLVGDGKAFNETKAKVKELGLSDEVIITGRVEYHLVEQYYSLIDIAPFPRKPLPVCEIVSPLKPFEAMALEKAIVVSDVQALKEIIEDEKTGLHFKKGDVLDLANKLAYLIENPEARETFGKNARQWVSSNRTWKMASEAFENVYNNVKKDSSKKLKVLVYGDLNLNYIDGSAVWAVSLVEVLSGVGDVDFLLKAKLNHDTLIQPLYKLDNVSIINPEINRMQPHDALKKIEALDSMQNYDAIVIRGFELAKEISKSSQLQGKVWPYLTDIPQTKALLTQELSADIEVIAKKAHTMFCQTKHAQKFLEENIPQAQGKTILLHPMIPDSNSKQWMVKDNQQNIKIVYAGKFAPLWASREMFETFIALRKDVPNLELHIFGDKIHNPADDPTFKSDIENYLTGTEGVVWYKARPREEVLNSLKKMDIAWAWRLPELELVTHELSTKVLEYGSVGLPTLLMKNEINQNLLGEDYPLFAQTKEDILHVLERVLNSKTLLSMASDTMFNASQRYMFGAIRKNHMQPLFQNLLAENLVKKEKKVILVVGHDLKFIDKLLEQYEADGHTVLIDKWNGHNKQDEAQSQKLLQQADTIICEWALGNAVWYSKNKLAHQKLLVRFHRQEIETDYPKEIDMHRVDKMIFVAEHYKRQAMKKFKWKDSDSLGVIGNYIDSNQSFSSKTSDAIFNLGIVGIVPKMKRFDRALDILEGVRKKDKRFKLFVKGKEPKDYPWIRNRADEMRYYDEVYARIDRSEYLRDAVHYDGFGKNMPLWYQKIGFILSVSDFESFHMSVADGAYSGTYPIILKWEGSDEIYPQEWSLNSVDEAVQNILKLAENQEFYDKVIEECKLHVEKYSLESIYRQWECLI